MKTERLPTIILLFCYLVHDEGKCYTADRIRHSNLIKSRKTTLKSYERLRRHILMKASEIAKGLLEINLNKIKRTYNNISKIVIPTPMEPYYMSNNEYYGNNERLLGRNAKIRDIIDMFLHNSIYRLMKIVFDVFVDRIHKKILENSGDENKRKEMEEKSKEHRKTKRKKKKYEDYRY